MEPLRFLAVILSTILSGTVVSCEGSVVFTQTHPAAPYGCRSGNITFSCQYDGVENVVVVLWVIGSEEGTANPSNISGHTALPRTTTYRELVVDSYTNLRERYQCSPVQLNGTRLKSNVHIPQIEFAEVTVSSLTLASRTPTTLGVTWSAGYPKCYAFAVSHSTQDGSINVTQPANSDTSHTLTSLQPGTTYRIEVEAVRKGDGADRQRAKVMGNFTTEDTTDVVPSGTVSPTTSSAAISPTASSEIAGITHTAAIIGGVVGGLSVLVLILVAGILVSAILGFLVYRKKTLPGIKASAPKEPKVANASQGHATQSSDATKQTYAVLDWQNPEQRPVKAPDNEWFTVQYSEVHFAGTK